MSKKYNEIMNKVVVTDEMQERLLAQISAADPELLRGEYKTDDDETFANAFSSKKVRKFQPARVLGILAAACAIILVGVAVSRIGMKSQQTAEYYEEAAAPEEAEEVVGASEYDTGKTEGTVDSNAASAEAADTDTFNGNIKSEATEDLAETAAPETAEEEIAAEADTTAEETVSEAGDEALGEDSGEPIELSEEEIRQVVEDYMGEDYIITEMAEEDSVLTYTIAEKTDSSTANSYIRIDVSSGKVQITDVVTGEIEDLDFRVMLNR